MSEPLHAWPARRLAAALERGELRALDIAEACAERIAATEPALRAWAWFDPVNARREAAACDAAAPRGPLHGLPVAVKDIIDTAGLPTEHGSPIYRGHVPQADAAAVALARAAGAWVAGKTATTEFANMTPAPTRHPRGGGDARRTPGGSSSGSAAAVAAGCVPLALGTQTAGSLIRPAAFCGVVAWKPSPRRVPRAGAKSNSDTLDEVGVFARSVDDAALLAGVLAGTAFDDAPFPPALRPTLAGRANDASRAMQGALVAAAAAAARHGARVQPLDDATLPPSFAPLFDAQRTVQAFETARALAPEHRLRRDELSPGLAALLDAGAAMPPAAFRDALRAGQAAQAQLEALFAGADVLLAPAAPGAAPAPETTGDPLFNRPWQLLGCPCIALPAGDDEGWPLGLQLIARPGDDARLFAAARWLEAVLQRG
jgi:amidase